MLVSNTILAPFPFFVNYILIILFSDIIFNILLLEKTESPLFMVERGKREGKNKNRNQIISCLL